MKDKSKAKRIVSADGLNIYYWINWDNNLTNAFNILHSGASMDHSSLDSIERGLTERAHPTIVFDPRGQGYSDAPTKKEFYQLERFSSDLQKIVEQEGLEKPEFVTHSLGFMPVLDYVAETKNASRIIGICASPKFSETAPSKALFHVFNKALRYVDYLGSLAMKVSNTVNGNAVSYPDQSNLEGKSDFEVWKRIVNISLQRTRGNTISGTQVNKWDIANQLCHLYTPLLLIYGREDVMVRPLAGEYIKLLSRGECDVEIIKGTHSLPLTRPKEVLRVIDKYSK